MGSLKEGDSVAQVSRLANETSPYLLQHAHNPVDWYPWGPEALARAREENRLIFLSIGYSACHWCHVMERESFEDPETAGILNAHFIAIKVDREERPDLDEIYMTAVRMMTGSAGWPLNVFLTPELKPFYGGTYFPPEDRHGMSGFKRVLTSLAQLWREKPADSSRNAEEVVRTKPYYDGAVPSGNAAATPVLLRLAKLLDKADYAQKAEAVLSSVPDTIRTQTRAYLNLLCAADFHLRPTREIAIVGRRDKSDAKRLLEVIHRRFVPNKVVALLEPGAPDAREAQERVPLLRAKRMINGKATVYLCEDFVCKRPVTDPADLRGMLDGPW